MPRNTLQTLRRLVAVLWAADAILLIASLIGAQVHRDGLQAVTRNSAPSIIAAQHLQAALSAMESTALRGTVTAYESRRQEAAGALLAAAENITYGDAEREPIRKLQLGLGTYEAMLQRARELRERNDASYPAANQNASRVMSEILIPAAEELSRVNLRQLESAYESQQTHSMLSRAAVILAAIVLLFVFISAQTYLSRRTNRILNLALVAATLFAFAWSAWVVSLLSLEEHHLKVAKQDAFVSLNALWQARAVIHAMQADQYKYLTDKAHAQVFDAHFTEEANRLLKVPQGMTIQNVASAARGPGSVRDISGLFADELNNITFAGERTAAVQSVLDYSEYLASDREVRRLETTGKHAEAVALAIGIRPGDTNWAFQQLDRSLTNVTLINQKEFDQAVLDGFGGLQYFEAKTVAISVLIGILSLLGLLQRIAEYR